MRRFGSKKVTLKKGLPEVIYLRKGDSVSLSYVFNDIPIPVLQDTVGSIDMSEVEADLNEFVYNKILDLLEKHWKEEK